MGVRILVQTVRKEITDYVVTLSDEQYAEMKKSLDAVCYGDSETTAKKIADELLQDGAIYSDHCMTDTEIYGLYNLDDDTDFLS